MSRIPKVSYHLGIADSKRQTAQQHPPPLLGWRWSPRDAYAGGWPRRAAQNGSCKYALPAAVWPIVHPSLPTGNHLIKDAIGFKRFRVCTAAIIITACNDLQSDQSPNRPGRQDLVSRFTHDREAQSACVDCRPFVVAAPTSFAPSMPRPLHIAMTQVARAVESLSIIETKAPDVVVCLSRS